jgi:hypothetical protein
MYIICIKDVYLYNKTKKTQYEKDQNYFWDRQ